MEIDSFQKYFEANHKMNVLRVMGDRFEEYLKLVGSHETVDMDKLAEDKDMVRRIRKVEWFHDECLKRLRKWEAADAEEKQEIEKLYGYDTYKLD